MAFWSSSKKRDKREPDTTTLSDIIRGIQYCVNSAYEIVERHYMEVTDKYFDGAGKPISRRFYINDHYAMDVPEITMHNLNSLQLDEMVVKMNLEIKTLDVKSETVPSSGANAKRSKGPSSGTGMSFYELSRSSFEVEPSSPTDKKGAHMEIEMKFKAGDPPEAVSRMIEQFNNSVTATHIENLKRSE